MQKEFASQGFLGPVQVLTSGQCRELKAEFRNKDYPLLPDWPKALAVSSSTVYRIATQPSILNIVKNLLGDDIMLWGASFIRRRPGHVHPWHNDIESSVATGKSVSVWIGIENTSRNAALHIISRSHLIRKSVQEVRHGTGMLREKTSSEDILKLAQKSLAECELVVPEISDGSAIFFDGWVWHAAFNTGNRIRTVLLLQYATPETLIRIPDPNNFEWPFKTLNHPKPPCIMVSGSDYYGVNRVVPAPVSHDGREAYTLTTQTYAINVPLALCGNEGWNPYPIFRGSTPNLQSITCHASVLNAGFTPHPPHQHKEEEILILLDGQATVTLPDLSKEGLPTQVVLEPGEFVYYPAWFYHTITANGTSPASYLMFKWYNTISNTSLHKRGSNGNLLTYGKYKVADLFSTPASNKGFHTSLVFQGPTDCLAALQCHTTTVSPGGGYAMHTDAHDVAILVLKGEIESLGERAGPFTVLYFPAGHPHDMRNPTQEQAEYLVFEFHGNNAPAVKRKKKTLWEKMQDPKAWSQKMEELRRRFLI